MSGKRQFGTVRKLPLGRWQARYRDESGQMLPAGLDENGSASFAEDASAYLHADAKRRRLMTAVTDRRAPKCFLWSCG